MTDARHQRAFDVFLTVCDLPNAEREHRLHALCADDPGLRADVERLLAHDDADEHFLQIGAAAEMIGARPATTGAESHPQRLGEYRILSLLGTGGMGVVYVAEQETPRRVVALKVLRPDAATPELLSRFAHETELLARLQHPSIAQIYEAGTADAGFGPQPFFAMEYVRGLPLLEYADANRLDVNDRLKLIAQLCESLHYAHQKGIIHRDLKPANILINEDGQPKILDFGVARAIDADALAATFQTTFGELIGTVPYMSPEQAAGDLREIDIRSDVYALGVVGYELLAGRLPYDLDRRMIHEAARIICEQPAAPLSSVRARLRGDIETILAKALEKERGRRYQSALEFGEDIRRYLRDEPITARPASAIYQMKKFAQRNTALVASGVIILLLLVIGIIVTSILAAALSHQRDDARSAQRRAEHARAEAENALAAAQRETAVATAVSGFLEDVFASGSPYVGRHDMTVAEALDIAAGRVEERLADQPEVAALVHQRLSDTYFSLGRLDASLEQARLAFEQVQAEGNLDPLAVAQSRTILGQLLMQAGNLKDAETHLREAMSIYDEHAEEQDPARLTAMTDYGVLLYRLKRYEEAEPIMRRTYALREKVHGPEHPYTLTALNNLACLVRDMGRPEDAEPLMRLNMRLHVKAVGEKHPNTITGIYNYADLLRRLGRYDEAEAHFQRCLALGREHLPTGHWMVGLYHDGYGELLREMRRFEEAETHLLDGYHTLSEQLGDAHPRTRRAVDHLIALYEDWGRPAQAEEWRAR